MPMVLLRHTLPDGTEHLDWLIARQAAHGPLASLRLPRWPLLGRDTVEVDVAPDHDRTWLERQGDVSQGRGTAWGIDQGMLQRCLETAQGLHMDVCWARMGAQSLLLSKSDGGFELAVLPAR